MIFFVFFEGVDGIGEVIEFVLELEFFPFGLVEELPSDDRLEHFFVGIVVDLECKKGVLSSFILKLKYRR